MATYYVWDGGSNGAGTDWTSAKTTWQAIALASASGDVIKVAHAHWRQRAGRRYDLDHVEQHLHRVCGQGQRRHADPMGTAAWLGSSSTSVALTVAGAYRLRIYGHVQKWRGDKKSISIAGA